MGKADDLVTRTRIAEIRAAWPTAFQSVIERRPDCWLAERDEVAKQCLDKVSLACCGSV